MRSSSIILTIFSFSTIFVVLDFVDFWFFLVWSRCPFTIAKDAGGCIHSDFVVSPGILMNPFSNADSSVDSAGDPNVA